MTVKTCFSCGKNFQTNFVTVNSCNVCLQTRKIEKMLKAPTPTNNRDDEAWRYINQRFENARLSQQREKIREQNQAIMETSITHDDAFYHGFNYIETEWQSNNIWNLEIKMSEYAEILLSYTYPYVSDDLRSSFQEGLFAKIDEIKNYDKDILIQTLKQKVYKVGVAHVMKSFPLWFNINSEVKLNGVFILTKLYNSKLSLAVDENGTLSAQWNKFFDNEELNSMYQQGITETVELLNTPEEKQKRIELREEENRQNLVKEEYKKRDAIFTKSSYILPLIFLGFLWNVVSGWWTITAIIFSWIMWAYFKKSHRTWQTINKQYLT